MSDPIVTASWEARLRAVLFVTAFSAATALMAVLALLAVTSMDGSPRTTLIAVQAIGMGIPALLADSVSRRCGMGAIGWRWRAWLPGIAVLPLVFIGSFVLSAAIQWIWLALLTAIDAQAVMDSVARSHDQLVRVLGGETLGWRLVLAAVLPGIVEELAFRGVIQRILRTAFGPMAAITITASIFSLVHFDSVGLATRLFLGISLGIAFERTGSLLAPVLLHFAHDAFVITVWWWRGDDQFAVTGSPPELSVTVALVLLVLGGATWGSSMLGLRRGADPPDPPALAPAEPGADQPSAEGA